MGIFDPNNNADYNAYLNWWFDERLPDKEVQISWDFLNMGKAYYANAIVGLSMFVDSHNACNIADKMIFPILFGFWHGTELLLKAGLYLAEKELNTGNCFSKRSHDNYQLFSEFMSRLKMIGFKKSDLKDLKEVLDDFKEQNALPTFMRYTVDDKQNEQFYVNIPPEKFNLNGEETVCYNNVCLNIPEFINKFIGIISTLPVLIEFLGNPYFGDAFCKGELNKANFVKYSIDVQRIEASFGLDESEFFVENLDVTNKMLNWVTIHLL